MCDKFFLYFCILIFLLFFRWLLLRWFFLKNWLFSWLWTCQTLNSYISDFEQVNWLFWWLSTCQKLVRVSISSELYCDTWLFFECLGIQLFLSFTCDLWDTTHLSTLFKIYIFHLFPFHPLLRYFRQFPPTSPNPLLL